MASFKSDYESPEAVQAINTDVADGKALEIGGTPGLFISSKKLENLDSNFFRTMIRQELGQN